MISSLVYCCADAAGHIPQNSGYQVLAALSKYFTQRHGLDMFHSVTNQKKSFTISSLCPVAFWSDFLVHSRDGFVPVERDQIFAFRVCFFDDAEFDTFCQCENARIEINRLPFNILRVTQPGKGLNRAATPERLLSLPQSDGIEMHFVSPTGFTQSETNVQYLFPDPRMLFGSLARSWERQIGPLPELPDDRDILFARVNVRQYSLRSTTAAFKFGSYKHGFVGTISYGWEKHPDAVKRVLTTLAAFAFFSGVGYKTTMGLGQTIPSLDF